MIIKMLIAIAVLAGIYFYMQKSENNNNVHEDRYKTNKLNFYASDKFDGKMDGYVFKMGDKGLGYYIDQDSL